MKRYGNIIKEAAQEVNLMESFDYVLRGNKRKTSRSGKYLIEHKQEIIQKLRQELLDGTFKVGAYHEEVVKEGVKLRAIQCVPLEKRIAINSVMTVIEKYLCPSFVADTAASIKERGGLYLFDRIKKAYKENPGMIWFYKCDIHKFYPSIDQEVMKMLVRKRFKDHLLIDFLDQCICMLPEGISIGLRSSQVLANLLLSVYVDHVVKDKHGCKFYWRYCDDMAVGASSAKELEPIIKVIHQGVESANMEIKPNEQVFCIKDRPLDFLGYRLFYDGKILIRKRTKQNFAKRWKRERSIRRKTELIGSFYGLSKHVNAKHLFLKITKINMKDFAELGLKYVSKNGKKIFDCETIRMNDLQNRQFVVKDYEVGVDTKQGKERYLVQIILEEKEYKFFTNSEEMKQMLDQAKEINEIPFRTVLRRTSLGNNKYKYSFT